MKKDNHLGIIGFTAAIIACTTFIYPYMGIVMAILAIGFSTLGLGEDKFHHNIAKAGLILGCLMLILSCLTTAYYISEKQNMAKAPVVICPSPYIYDLNHCCLDLDDNFVCDYSEGPKEIYEVEEEILILENIDLEDVTEHLIEEVDEEPVLVEEEEFEDEPTYEEEVPLTIYDLFSAEIEYFSSLFDEDYFMTKHLDVSPDTQLINVGETGVYVIRIKNNYDKTDPHYYKINIRGRALNWIINADEEGSSSYNFGPYATQEEYLDIPVFLTVGNTFGSYSQGVTEGGKSYKFTFNVLDSDKLEYAVFKSIAGERSFEILVNG
jgi:hypothetical protein